MPIVPSRITFEKGLLESQESSKLDIGFLTRCVNWVPEPNGGLRVRAGWSRGSVTGVPSTRRNRGIGMFSRFTAPSVVQVSTPVKTGVNTNGVAITPSVSWATPTTLGNTLLCVVAVGVVTDATFGGTMTFTVSASGTTAGWSIRSAMTGSNLQYVGVLEIPVSTLIQTGAQTPFTIQQSAAAPISVIAWLVEVAGVSAFDQTGSGVATAASSVSATAGTTTQASEFVIAIDSSKKPTPVGSYTLSTTSTNWSELTEAGQDRVSGDANPAATHEVAIYTGTRSAIGGPSITVDSTLPVGHALTILTYKGWNSSATVTPITTRWLTANDDGSNLDIYSIDRSTLPTASFSVIDENASVSNGFPVAFTMALGAAYYTASSFTAGIRRYDGITAAAVAGSPIGARCIAANYSHLWVGGTPALPSRLFFSQVLQGGTWTGTGTGYFDFGSDDGEFIEDISPFAGGMVVGKKTSLHFLTGSSTDDFAPVQLDGGGAAPGRSILATPYGCVIAGLDQVWSFDGSQVRPLGRAIESSYGLSETDYVSTSYIDGVIYVAVPSLGKVFAYNLNAGTWRIEQVGDGDGETPAILYNYGATQLYGPREGTIGSLLNYRTFPDPARVKDFDPLPEVFMAQTGDLALAGARRPISPRQMYMQIRQRGGDESEPGLLVTPVFDELDGDVCDVDSSEPGVRRTVVEGFPQLQGINTVGVRIEQRLEAGDSSVTDVEDAYIDINVEEARSS